MASKSETKSPPNTGHVELHPAFVWDCPECGRESFVRSVVPEFSPEDLGTIREQHGIQPYDLEEREFYMMPTSVTCPHCGIQFATVDYLEDGAETEDEENMI